MFPPASILVSLPHGQFEVLQDRTFEAVEISAHQPVRNRLRVHKRVDAEELLLNQSQYLSFFEKC